MKSFYKQVTCFVGLTGFLINFNTECLNAATFVRINSGFGILNRLDDYSSIDGYAPASRPKNSNLYGINIGYKFQNNVSLDFGYKKFDKFKYSAKDNAKYFYSQNIGISSYTINAQYNFENNSKIYPFARVGIGLSKNKLGKYNAINLDDKSKEYALNSNTSNNFTFNVGAGIGYRINDKLAADFNYQYHDLGEIKNSSEVLKNTIGETIKPPVSSLGVNSFSLGISYYFN